MVNKEDINVLVEYLDSHTADNEITNNPALCKVHDKLLLLQKQINLQSEFQEESLKIRKEFENLDKLEVKE